MKNLLARFSLFSLLLCTGCTTVRYATVFNGARVDGGARALASVEVENSGWFLFGFIPLASGEPLSPDACACRLFENTVTLENNYSVLMRLAKEKGAAAVANMTSHWTDESAFIILLKRRAYHTSAVLVKPEDVP